MVPRSVGLIPLTLSADGRAAELEAELEAARKRHDEELQTRAQQADRDMAEALKRIQAMGQRTQELEHELKEVAEQLHTADTERKELRAALDVSVG